MADVESSRICLPISRRACSAVKHHQQSRLFLCDISIFKVVIFCQVITMYTYLINYRRSQYKNNIYAKSYSDNIVYRGVMTSLAMPKTDFIFPWNLFSEISRITPLSREINSRVGRLRYFFARDTLYNSEIDFNAGCARRATEIEVECIRGKERRVKKCEKKKM